MFLLGLLWESNYKIVFFCGAAISCMSLMVAFTIKSEPLKRVNNKTGLRGV
ncbi:major Facilitator Superfamily domain protein [Photobacterium leiognathi lrivu.4.1]|uniref:Major Facilitator Superfamily domain protein n=1 Tax=Photobacterium leiognathi lrivu.4.1 TaxID=1248232 RepID=V5H4G7_PHOLE|nr:major Facilitator Superfamily domain protein [Photobacterium leiognathi lrivu.4.1]